jgi:hypothetical protein
LVLRRSRSTTHARLTRARLPILCMRDPRPVQA